MTDRFEKVRHAAEHSVGKAVAFAGFGIMTVMVGLSYDINACLRVGAILVSLLSAVLFLQAMRAPAVDFRRTETWLLLAASQAELRGVAPQVLPAVLADTYQRFGRWTAVTAGLFWVVAATAALT
jgi:hypothetical protein